ncbi:hypothetical protein QYM36_016543 [Artemia franciscana]|uniref:Uncharacterized protein n=1 Tax=Artemia franciscana TaxID=6661 RepID=A0AA88HJK0_ARTSF|nr:hypothetical protein QYM36_016543 [Artemia franciscana]
MNKIISMAIPVSCVGIVVWWASGKYAELKEELRRLRKNVEELSSFQILEEKKIAAQKERCSEDASDVAPVQPSSVSSHYTFDVKMSIMYSPTSVVGSHSFLPVVTNDSSPPSTMAVKLADSRHSLEEESVGTGRTDTKGSKVNEIAWPKILPEPPVTKNTGKAEKSKESLGFSDILAKIMMN